MWDGTERVKAKSKMTQLTLKDLGRGDLAIVECQVHRYHAPYPEKKITHAPWVTWRATFQLAGITRLWAATPNTPVETESDVEEVQREETDDEYEGF